MNEGVCQLFEVFQHEFANFSLPCEGRFTVTKESYQTIFCLNECNYLKLFYFNHRIIYCDQRELSNDFLR